MKAKRLYQRHRFRPDMIHYAVWLYDRFALSFRDIADLLAERGVIVSYETVRRWRKKFESRFASRLRKHSAPCGDTWHVDEVFVPIRRRQFHLYRAVDQNGDVLDRYCQLVEVKAQGSNTDVLSSLSRCLLDARHFSPGGERSIPKCSVVLCLYAVAAKPLS